MSQYELNPLKVDNMGSERDERLEWLILGLALLALLSQGLIVWFVVF